jgi:hypothetical protein
LRIGLQSRAIFTELDDVSSWIGLVALAGTPKPVIDKIQVVAIYKDYAVVDRLDKAGINPVT